MFYFNENFQFFSLFFFKYAKKSIFSNFLQNLTFSLPSNTNTSNICYLGSPSEKWCGTNVTNAQKNAILVLASTKSKKIQRISKRDCEMALKKIITKQKLPHHKKATFYRTRNVSHL